VPSVTDAKVSTGSWWGARHGELELCSTGWQR
jgi:hypothetical protein